MKGKTAAAAGAAPSQPNPKSLVMVDGAGKMATLKLTTQTGLHFYDGQMLWVNPAQTVTASAPRSTAAAAAAAAGQKSTKALAIVDPTSGEELVVKKPDPPPAPKEPATSSAPAALSQPVPTNPGLPGITTGSSPLLHLSGSSFTGQLFGGGMMPLATMQPTMATMPTTPPILIHPSSSTSLFSPQATKKATGSTAAPGEQNVLDLLAKATKTSPSTLLALSQPLISTAHPTKGGRNDRDERKGDQGRGNVKGGKSNGKSAGKGAPTEGKGKGRGGRGAGGYTNNFDQNKPRKKFDQVRNDGDKYTKDATYSASLDGRFWSLSCWPDGKRDETHGLTFGKHRLNVLEGGVVKIVLIGGVNRYKIRLHLGKEGEEFVGEGDKDGWTVASCEPNAANLLLSEEAEKFGWKIHRGEHPCLYPPGSEVPPDEEVPEKPVEAKDAKKSEEKAVEEKPAEEKPAEEKPAEEKPAEEKPAEEKPAEEKPAEEKPAEEKPAEEKPVEEKKEEKTEESEEATEKVESK